MSIFEKAMDQLATELESRGQKTRLVGTDLYLVDGDEMQKLDVKPAQVTCTRVVPDNYGIQMLALDTLIKMEESKH